MLYALTAPTWYSTMWHLTSWGFASQANVDGKNIGETLGQPDPVLFYMLKEDAKTAKTKQIRD